MFLRDEDIAEIKKFVPGALCEVSHLICCVNDDAMPIGFMGIEDKRIEMLFISPKARGNGIGRPPTVMLPTLLNPPSCEGGLVSAEA